jgi:hypothetical protein
MSETLLSAATPIDGNTAPEVAPLGEGRMVREDCWRQVHRLFHVERRSKSEIARDLNLDRKTVRGILWRTWSPAVTWCSRYGGSRPTVWLLPRWQEEGIPPSRCDRLWRR